MSSAAFVLEITLASFIIVTSFASSPSCISCPCGSNRQNFTHCDDELLDKDFTCERWSHCQTCKANTTFCITCPPDRFGPTCSEISGGHTRRKRQDDPDLLNHPNYPRQSGSCPFLERPESGSIRCSQTGNERYCTSRCLPGYHFEGEENVSEITLRCRRGVWKPRSSFPPCRSGGHCEVEMTGVSGGFYNCTINMEGTHCDITCGDWYQGRFHCYPGRPWDPPLPYCAVPKERASCRCEYGGVCDLDGKCICPDGRTGTYCENLEREKATCPDPGIPRDGSRLNPDGSDASYPRVFEEGESVVFTCNSENAALQGKTLITCLEDGTWSAPLPRCITSRVGPIVYCPDPGYIQFGSRMNADGSTSRPSSRYRTGQSVVYFCHAGYELVGNDILTCLQSGRWSSTKPFCRRNNFAVTRPTEGREPPSGTSCRHPGVDINGLIKDHPLLDPRRRGQTFPPGTELEFDCKEGFEPEGPAVIISCMTSGEWSSAPPTCRKIITTTTEMPTLQETCSHPGVDVNGRIEGDSLLDPRRRSFPAGTELKFSCNDGFEPEGATIIACLNSGRWTSLPPKCRNVVTATVGPPPSEITQLCPFPEVNPNVEVEEFFNLDPRKPQGFESGDELTFKCKEGYELEGPRVIECLGNSRWSSSPPTCNPKSRTSNTPSSNELQLCPTPEVDPNGEVEEFLLDPRKLAQGFEPGTELTVRCKEGYILQGWGTIRCGSGGRWSTPSPKCNIKPRTNDGTPSQTRCLNPGHIANGRMDVFPPFDDAILPPADDDNYDFPLGTHLKFTCEEGFKLDGESSLNCESDGYWSGSTPMCVTDCGRSLVSTTDRITHGTAIIPGEWPWTVAIAADGDIICGGALLDTRTVLTAAHCLAESGTAQNFTLFFGKHNRSIEHDDEQVKVGESYQLILHPDFNEESFDNDIAIVKFQPDVRYSERIQPVCLPTRNTTARNVVPGRKGYVSSACIYLIPININSGCV